MKNLSRIKNTRLTPERYTNASGTQVDRYLARLSRRFTGAKPIKKRFDDVAEAKAWILSEVEKKKQQGAAGFALSAGQTEQATRAFALLDGKASLTEAVEYFMKIRFPKVGTKTITQAVAAWVSAKTEEGLSHDYLTKIKEVFSLLIEAFPEEKEIHTVTTAELEAWFKRCTKRDKVTPISGATWNHRRADFSALWSWCIAKGWAGHNPAQELKEKPQVTPSIGILTPSQTLTVLKAAADQPGCPYLAFLTLSLFTGIRTAELQRMTWANIILEEDEPRVIVGATDAKDKESRVIDIPANAVAWLKLCPFTTGPIHPQKKSARNDLATLRASVGKWPKNAGRHSFVSYRSRLAGEAVASEAAGHESVRITRKRYKGLVSRRASEAYFSITPDTNHQQLAAMLAPPALQSTTSTTAAATA